MFRFLTAGESHGRALVGVLEGLPSGLAISLEKIQHEMKRRKSGYGRGHRQKIEDDGVQILSGVRHGRTLGSPIALLIENRDWKNWQKIMAVDLECDEKQVYVPRPGHADHVGGIKYKHSDLRNVLERASARETAMRVALGSVARQFLEAMDIAVASRVIRVGRVSDETPLNIPVEKLNALLDARALRCLSEDRDAEMVEEVHRAKKAGDTVGGHFEVLVSGLPLGLGSYSQWDRRLEGHLAQAVMSMNAVKGVELGLGFRSGEVFGSEAHDEMIPGGKGRVDYKSNRSGGITGGMTTGQTLIVRGAMKPIATLMKPLDSVNLRTMKKEKAHVERSDVSAVPACAVICESVVALVLTEALIEKFGGDSMEEFTPRFKKWKSDAPPPKK